jgi:hypothetical protein
MTRPSLGDASASRANRSQVSTTSPPGNGMRARHGSWRHRRVQATLACGFAAALSACNTDSGDTVNAAAAIVLDTIVVLDFSAAPAAPDHSARVARQPGTGRLAVAASGTPSEILIFDQDGSFLRAIGRRGAGPGELGGGFGDAISIAFDAADSLWIFQSGRADVWSPAFEYVRSIRPAFTVRDAAAAPAGGFLLVADDSEDPGARLLQGDTTIPLMPVIEPGEGRDVDDAPRSIASAGDERFWIAGFEEFDLLLVDFNGDVVQRHAKPPAWWQAANEPEAVGMMATRPALLDIASDAVGQLWAIAGIPTPSDDLLAMMQAPDAVSRLPELLPLAADHRLLVIDPRTGTTLADSSFDYLPVSFLDQRFAYSVQPDSLAGFRIVLWTYGLAVR